LYSPLHDPNYIKLQSRLERKLLTQLLSGCKQAHCSNSPWCATATGHSIPMVEAMKAVKPQVDGMLGDVEFHICVDEVIQRRAFLAGMIAAEGVYSFEWCRKAIEEVKGDLGKARNWLERNARRNNE
jgi:Amino-terminal Zinc-binding domain of ubiquitin ligase E3A